MNRLKIAWILILIVDVAYIAWGAAVAIAPDHVLGPGGKAILPAGFEGYSGGSWTTLVAADPRSAGYMAVLYRLYGVYCVLFGFMGSSIALTAFRRGERWAWWTLLVGNTVALLAAMTYDKLVNAIGPFELTEYLGLALVWGAFAITRKPRTGEAVMKHAVAAIIVGIGLASSAGAQTRPKLHVNTRWEECSIQLDPTLTQAAWRQFTKEAGQVVYFRPMVDARPMGRGKFELSFMQWQTNIDDADAAWNDTFVHPDSLHWLFEGSGLQFPGLAGRAGISSSTDLGVYFTKNVKANYGAYGVQLQQALIRGKQDWDVSARASYMALFGPDDVDLGVYGVDVIASWRQWKLGRTTLTPYAGVATYLTSSHEKANAVSLEDEQAFSAMGTVGASLAYSFMRFGAEASISRVPSVAMKVGFSR